MLKDQRSRRGLGSWHCFWIALAARCAQWGTPALEKENVRWISTVISTQPRSLCNRYLTQTECRTVIPQSMLRAQSSLISWMSTPSQGVDRVGVSVFSRVGGIYTTVLACAWQCVSMFWKLLSADLQRKRRPGHNLKKKKSVGRRNGIFKKKILPPLEAWSF